jgi:aminoglycoside N3'-acetyltransferase
MPTRESLATDAARLGIEAGDTIFVHSSLKSIGPVNDGASSVVGALEDVLGQEGLLLMPSFNLLPKGGEARAQNWDRNTTPSSVGWITEFFRTMPGTVRSDHYSHSVAARGINAKAFVSDHLSLEGMESHWDRAPWGRTFGTQSPMLKASRLPHGKVLMLGTNYDTLTYRHVIEAMFWAWQKTLRHDHAFTRLDGNEIFVVWDQLDRQKLGNIGDANCRLCLIDEFLTTLLDAAKADPTRFFKLYQD